MICEHQRDDLEELDDLLLELLLEDETDLPLDFCRLLFNGRSLSLFSADR